MKKIACEIFTHRSFNEVESILNNVAEEKTNVTGSRTYLIGKLEKNKFRYKTYDSPPIEINGLIASEENGTRVSLDIRSESMKGQLKALTYALCYPIIFVFLLLSLIKYPDNIANYIVGPLALLIPIIIHKVYSLFFYYEPNPDYIVTKLAFELNGKVENKITG